MTDKQRLSAVTAKLMATQQVLGTLISWLAQGAGGPLRVDEAHTLLRRLNNPEKEN